MVRTVKLGIAVKRVRIPPVVIITRYLGNICEMVLNADTK